MDREMSVFHPSTNLEYITQDSFFIRINQNDLYSVLKFDDYDAVDVQASDLKTSHIDQMLSSLQISPIKKSILGKFVTSVMNDVIKIKGIFLLRGF
jgi:hypothetical protein